MSKISISQEKELTKLIFEYSKGNYQTKGKISKAEDKIDVIIHGVNMLGEELMATSVSKDYFLNIYNAVTDLIIILDEDWKITETNKSFNDTFNKLNGDHINIDINDIFKNKKPFLTVKNLENLNEHGTFVFEENLNHNDINIYGIITCSKIYSRSDIFEGYLVVIKDITELKKAEKSIIQAIISTEQEEQKRMANDLHDSLGQELSMAKLMLTNLSAYKFEQKEEVELLNSAKVILDNAITHLREICFNLMPSVLSKTNINLALIEFIKILNHQNIIKFKYSYEGNFDNIDNEIEIMIYRIVQEFVNNAIKHSKCKNVTINFSLNENRECLLYLEDDGVGFDLSKVTPTSVGRGIQNLRAKIKFFNGNYSLNSSIGNGTVLKIFFPNINEI